MNVVYDEDIGDVDQCPADRIDDEEPEDRMEERHREKNIEEEDTDADTA